MESRPFTSFERMIDITDRRYPFNAVVVLHMAPAPDPAQVRAALTALQRYSPMLQARIADNGRRHFLFDVKDPIPLRTIRTNPETRWKNAAEHRLNSRLDSRHGPLLHVDLLAAEDSSRAALLFTFHHTVMDASSTTPLLHEFLRLLAGKPAGPSEPGMPDIETRLPRPFRGRRLTLALSAFMARQVADEFTFLLHSINHPAPPVHPEGKCRIFDIQLTEADTRRFVEKARAAGVTLNSALNAALGITCNHVLFQGDSRLLRMITFADLRPYLDPPLSPNVLGNAISMLRITQPVDTGIGLWQFAQQIHSKFVEGLRRGDKFATCLMADRMVQMVLGLNRVRLGTTAMSYTGPVDFPDSGPFRVTGVNALISNNPYGPVLTAQARLFHDRLGMDVLIIDSDLAPEQAEEIRAELCRLLGTSTQDDPH